MDSQNVQNCLGPIIPLRYESSYPRPVPLKGYKGIDQLRREDLAHGLDHVKHRTETLQELIGPTEKMYAGQYPTWFIRSV